MTFKSEYFIKKIKFEPGTISPAPWGLYFGNGLIGFYSTYQKAKRDMIRMREDADAAITITTDWNWNTISFSSSTSSLYYLSPMRYYSSGSTVALNNEQGEE